MFAMIRWGLRVPEGVRELWLYPSRAVESKV
jgi:hypothetical protein